MIDLEPVRLKDLKLRGRILYKALCTPGLEISDQNIRGLVTFAWAGNDERGLVYDRSTPIRLKDAYRLMARYYGFVTWAALRQHVIDMDCFYRKFAAVFVFKWFRTYSEARQHHRQAGGFLLRFWGDFVVCGEDYIERLGLMHLERAWQAVGYDGVCPNNIRAWAEIRNKAVNNYLTINK